MSGAVLVCQLTHGFVETVRLRAGPQIGRAEALNAPGATVAKEEDLNRSK
jgi:hypothetical protein